MDGGERRWRDEADFHVVWMLVIYSPAVVLGWWWLAFPLLIPQGRICVRAFHDYPRFGRRPWLYLIANELMVFAAVGLLAGLRLAVVEVGSPT